MRCASASDGVVSSSSSSDDGTKQGHEKCLRRDGIPWPRSFLPDTVAFPPVHWRRFRRIRFPWEHTFELFFSCCWQFAFSHNLSHDHHHHLYARAHYGRFSNVHHYFSFASYFANVHLLRRMSEGGSVHPTSFIIVCLHTEQTRSIFEQSHNHSSVEAAANY